MQADPFNQYDRPSRYHRITEENDSLQRVHDRLDRIVAQGQRPRSGHLIRMLGLIAAAAVILLLVVIKPFSSNASEQLAVQHFSSYPNFVTPQMRGDQSIDESRRAAFAAYDNGDYAEAGSHFIAIAEEHTPEDKFYLAQCMEAQGLWKDALDILVKLDSIQPVYIDAVRWHTALCRLANGDREVARSLLIPLMTRNTEFASQARELVDDL